MVEKCEGDKCAVDIKPQTISACLIVKNEQELLPICLDSIKDIVDEIIVVDTGSTDKTVEIAKRYTDKVYHHEWDNSFSKARNLSIGYAVSDWVLYIDADEELDSKDAENVKKVINAHSRGNVSQIQVMLCNKKLGSNRVSGVHRSSRILRKSFNPVYFSSVHNQLKIDGDVIVTDIKLYHYGYALGQDKMDIKFKRTTELLRQQIKDDSKDPIPYHFLGISYLGKPWYSKAIDTLKQSIEVFRAERKDYEKYHQYILSHSLLAFAYYEMYVIGSENGTPPKILEDYIKIAHNYCHEVLKIYPSYLDAQYLLAIIYFRFEDARFDIVSKNYMNLLEDLRVNPGARVLPTPYSTIDRDFIVLPQMAVVAYEKKDQKRGYECMKMATDGLPADRKGEVSCQMVEYLFRKNKGKLCMDIMNDMIGGLYYEMNGTPGKPAIVKK